MKETGIIYVPSECSLFKRFSNLNLKALLLYNGNGKTSLQVTHNVGLEKKQFSAMWWIERQLCLPFCVGDFVNAAIFCVCRTVGSQ